MWYWVSQLVWDHKSFAFSKGTINTFKFYKKLAQPHLLKTQVLKVASKFCCKDVVAHQALLLKPGPGLWTWTLKNLDLEKPGT